MSFPGLIGETAVAIRPNLTGFESEATRKLDEAAGRLGQRFSARLSQASDRVGQLGQRLGSLSPEKLEQIGGVLTRRVTLPLALAGGAAIKFGSDFETAFSRIEGLTGTTSADLAGMRAQVLALAGQTTRSPQELAEALYFISSAGITGKAALDILQASAKAAAAGLGDTAIVADLVTSAVNAYGAANLTAAQATDALTAAVRVGKAEPQDLAQFLGGVLPVAKAVGVSFQEVAAATGALTNAGAQTDVAVTGLRNILGQILAPSAQAKQQLAALGISSDQLRKTLSERGLLDTLFQLKDAVGDNATAFDAIFPDMRGLVQLLNLLGQDPQKVRAAFDEVANSVGATDRAFEAFQKTASFKLKQALVDNQAALIKLGDAALPLAASVLPKIAGAVETVADVFSKLPGPAQTVVVALGGMAALSGPIFTLAGNLKKMRDLLSGSSGIAGGATGAARGVSLFKTALGGIVVTAGMLAVQRYFDERDRPKREAAKAVQEIITAAGSDLETQRKALEAALKRGSVEPITASKGDPTGFLKSLDELGKNRSGPAFLKEVRSALANVRLQLKGQEADARAAAGALNDHAGATENDADAQRNLGTSLLENFLKSQGAALDTADAVAKLNEAIRGDDAERTRAENLRAVADASDSFTDAQQRLIDAQQKLNDIRAKDPAAEERKADLEAKEAALGLRDAKLGVLEAEQKLKELREHNKEIADAEKALTEAQNRSAKGTVNKTQAVIDAEEKLADAKAKQATDIERAELDVERAHLRVEEQTDAVAKAEQELADVRSGKLRAKELADAQRDVDRANRDVARSADALRDAEDRQRRTTEQLEQKKRDVTRALYDVIAAEKAEIDALALLNPALDTPAAKSAALRDRLQEIHDKLKDPAARKALEEFIAKLNPGVAAGADVAAVKLNALGVEVDKLTPRAKALSEYLAVIAGLAPAPVPPPGALPRGPIGGDSSGLGALFPGRAAGGRVERGQLYTILEGGQDETLLMPNMDGRIVPGTPAVSAGSTDRSINLHGDVTIVTPEPARDFVRELEDIAWMNQGW